MNRYKVVGYLRLDPEGAWTSLADVKATVEALQATIKQMGEQAAVLAKDGMAAKAQLGQMQRERDELQVQLKLSRFNQANAEAAQNGLQAKIRALTQQLDAEREKVKVEQEQLEIQAREGGRLKDQLTQFQALVRALSKDFHLEDMRKAEAEAQKCEAEGDMYGWNFHQGRASGIREEQFIVYRIMREHGVDPMKAVLDATTPESANGQCQECGGEGVVDSGGVSQFDQPIMIPCGCLPERRRR